jgi:hypothetical protein
LNCRLDTSSKGLCLVIEELSDLESIYEPFLNEDQASVKKQIAADKKSSDKSQDHL